MATSILAVGLALLSACNGDGPTEGLGNDGFAIIEGEVQRANGAVFTNGSVYISCGQFEDEALFGREGVTDEGGRYLVEMNAPSGTKVGLGVPPNISEFELNCEVKAPSGSPPFARATAPVRFESDATQRPTTIIDLQEVDPES